VDLAALLKGKVPTGPSSKKTSDAKKPTDYDELIAKLQKEVDDLKQKIKGDNKLDENESAIRAIMMGPDALAHKIKFLVDIPKWQQFKVFGDLGTSTEELVGNNMPMDILRKEIEKLIGTIKETQAERMPNLEGLDKEIKAILDQNTKDGSVGPNDLDVLLKKCNEILENLKKILDSINKIEENKSKLGSQKTEVKVGGGASRGGGEIEELKLELAANEVLLKKASDGSDEAKAAQAKKRNNNW
jgi:hypothetical protein